jgi:hypothetical protein
MEVEVDLADQPALLPISTSDNRPKNSADESGDTERLLTAETSIGQRADIVLPGAAPASSSLELQETPGPSQSLDYFQAIGRAARSGVAGGAIVCFSPESFCRRLRPGLLLDVPCAMLPHAQLCDICSPPDQCPHHISEAVAPPTLPSPDVAPLPDPLKQLNSSATLAAANPCLDLGMAGLPRAEELGGFIRTAGDNLAKSCVNCWSNGLEYHSHPLDECRWRPIELRSGRWLEWRKTLRFPVGCCFYCGCPQKVCPDCICDCGLQLSLILR